MFQGCSKGNWVQPVARDTDEAVQVCDLYEQHPYLVEYLLGRPGGKEFDDRVDYKVV